MYGSRKLGWAPPSFSGAPLPTSQAHAAVVAVAMAANLSEDMADQMCEAVDVLMRAVTPAEPAASSQHTSWADPRVLSVALLAMGAKLWQHI